jgi:hypothetical protein
MSSLMRKNGEHREAAARLREWTRERFALPEDAAILVTEIACALPGCPPRETIVAFWTADAKRHHFKIFKPIREVGCEDLPFAWQRDALAVTDAFECGCC